MSQLFPAAALPAGLGPLATMVQGAPDSTSISGPGFIPSLAAKGAGAPPADPSGIPGTYNTGRVNSSGKPIPGIYVTPSGAVPPAGKGTGVDPWSDIAAPAAATRPQVQQQDPWADVASDTAPSAKQPARQIGTVDALGTGLAEGLTFGLAPAAKGLAAVAGPDWQIDDPYRPGEKTDSALAPVVGAAKMIGNLFADHPDPEVKAAYDRGRQAAVDNQDLAKEQHPYVYAAGQLAGAMAVPIPGAGAIRAGTLGERIIAGGRAGGIGGTAFGAGEGVGHGESAGDVLKDAATTGLTGAVGGAVIHGAIGPRAPNLNSPGQQAARTAEIIGAPIPRGLASDSGAIQGATASTASVPVLGSRVTGALDRNAEAAGNMAGGSGAQAAINANRGRIDALYDSVRRQIDPDRVMPMPRTDAIVQRVIANRRAARNPHPAQGLEQFEGVGRRGASFNGAHRARVDAREAGNVLVPHPGYNAGDYNAITRAMTADIRDNVGLAARNSPGRARAAFDEAERSFGPLAEANAFLNKLTRHDPAATLEALGYNPATDRFSLDKFVTAMNKIKPEARPFVPTPSHRAAIEAIFQMGTHLKGAMRGRNTSHTSNAMILFDIAKTAGEIGVGVGAGVLSAGSVVGGAAGAAPALIFMHWLSSPATTATMSRWSRTYQAVLGSPTPARVAAFNIATRNLANTLGVPLERVMETIQRRITAPAEQDQQNPP